MILLKQADVYAPEHLGIKDVLIGGEGSFHTRTPQLRRSGKLVSL